MSIEFTFDAGRHLYFVQGRPVPSVTQVLHAAGLGADYSMVPPQRRHGTPNANWIADLITQ